MATIKDTALKWLIKLCWLGWLVAAIGSSWVSREGDALRQNVETQQTIERERWESLLKEPTPANEAALQIAREKASAAVAEESENRSKDAVLTNAGMVAIFLVLILSSARLTVSSVNRSRAVVVATAMAALLTLLSQAPLLNFLYFPVYALLDSISGLGVPGLGSNRDFIFEPTLLGRVVGAAVVWVVVYWFSASGDEQEADEFRTQ